jgi:hypothetical protein
MSFETAQAWLKNHGIKKYVSEALLKAERKRLINIQMQMELRDQEDQLDNEQWERDYQAGVLA